MKIPLSSGPHRSWLTVLPTLLALLIATASVSPAQAQACTWKTCPNIVFIMFDDLGLPNLTPYPQSPVGDTPQMVTPNIQALAEAGVRFDQYYVAPVCSPTRVSLLTGQYQQSFNIRKQLRYEHTFRGIPGAVVTLPEMLKSRGYATGHFGKWHVGFQKEEFRPQAMGFDTMYMLSDREHVDETGLTHCNPWVHTSDLGSPIHAIPPATTPPLPPLPPFQTTDLLFDQASAFIDGIGQGDCEASKNEKCEDEPPFFANIWLWAPHQEYHSSACQIPSQYTIACNANPIGRHRNFCGLVAHADDKIGALKQQIDLLPGNTIVIVASDNGNLNDLQLPDLFPNQNYPLRGEKGYLFEGAIRVPLITWVKPEDPKEKREPRTYDEPVLSLDLYPTLAEIAGASLAKNLDGQSFASVIFGPDSTPRNGDFFFENSFNNANIDGNGYDADRRWLDYAVRRRSETMGDWKLVFQHSYDSVAAAFRDDTYLFEFDNPIDDYEEDGENVAAFHQDKVASLKQDYLDWRRRETLLPFTVSNLVSDSSGTIEAEGRDVFDSEASMVRMAANTLYDFHDGDFGFSAWIKPVTPVGGNNNRIIAQKPGSWVLTWNSATSKVKLVIDNAEPPPATATVTLESTTTAPAGVWTPVSFSLFGWRSAAVAPSMRLYVGADHTSTSFVKLDSGIHGVAFAASNRVQIGGGFAGDGTVDETRAFKGSMRDIEMAVASWLPEEVGRYASAHLRYEDFEGTTSAWETSVIDSGATLGTHIDARMTQAKGLQVLLPAGTKAYLSESDLDDDSVGDSETRFRASFQFNPNGLNLPNNTQLRIFAGRQTSPATNPVTIDLRQIGGVYQVQGRVLLDTVSPLTYVTTAWYPVSGQTHIDFEWRAADPGFDEGSFSLSLNYQLMETLKKIDNGTRVINRVTLGAITPTPASVSSTLWIDHFESYR